ncbi:MAG: polymer-forming cytoskeletal protein [Deltaproteobacteria bacterium]|nr:polymer-forming cytoskeletal protein [Deltaproteobacteria bacterium]
MWQKAFFAVWLAGIAFAAASGSTKDRLIGSFPTSTQPIDVDMHGTVAEALQTVAKKAGWSLVVSAPTLDQKISLKTAKRPLSETLELVLEAGDLQARLQGTTLVVKPYKGKDDGEDEDEEAPAPPAIPGSLPGDDEDQDDDDDKDHGERAAYGQDLVVEKGEIVDDVVVHGGDLIVRGRVRGDAAAMGGNIKVEAGGVIEGDAAAMGGDVDIEKGGIVKGNISKIGGSFGGVFKNLAKHSVRAHESKSSTRSFSDDDAPTSLILVILTIFASIAAFVISVILIAFVPERIERVTSMLDTKPAQAAAGGILTVVGFLPFCVLLAVSVVGIALLPVAFFALVFVYVAGYTAISVWLGRKIPIFVGRKTLLGAMGVGLGALTLLAIVPWFGTLLCFCIATIGAGAVVISRFGTGPKITEASIAP